MEGGTTFHFVTGGIDDALARTREAAQGGFRCTEPVATAHAMHVVLTKA